MDVRRAVKSRRRPALPNFTFVYKLVRCVSLFPLTTPTVVPIVEMQYHQYSKLFTSGLLSDPSPAPRVPGTRLRRGRTLFLNQTDPESPELTDSRPYSFLELADSLASPVSTADPSFPWRSLGHHTISYVFSLVSSKFSVYQHLRLLCLASSSATTGPTPIRKPGLTRIHPGVLRSTALSATSPLDPLPQLSIVTADQSFLMTDPPLPDSPTLDRRPSHKTAVSISASSASISVNSETKRMNRLVALACLEGRESSSGRRARKTQMNFMSMSDDEDEDESLASSPRLPVDRVASHRSSMITASDISVLAILSSGDREVDLSPDPPVSQSRPQSKIASANDRPRSQTIESWFSPLSGLVDLRNEEDSPNWRSFIEFSTPAT